MLIYVSQCFARIPFPFPLFGTHLSAKNIHARQEHHDRQIKLGVEKTNALRFRPGKAVL